MVEIEKLYSQMFDINHIKENVTIFSITFGTKLCVEPITCIMIVYRRSNRIFVYRSYQLVVKLVKRKKINYFIKKLSVLHLS